MQMMQSADERASNSCHVLQGTADALQRITTSPLLGCGADVHEPVLTVATFNFDACIARQTGRTTHESVANLP
jgi:hypothetical protein